MLDVLPDERYAHPIVLGVQAIHFLTAASFWTSKAEETSILRSAPERRGAGGRWGRWEDEQRSRKFLGGWSVSYFPSKLGYRGADGPGIFVHITLVFALSCECDIPLLAFPQLRYAITIREFALA